MFNLYEGAIILPPFLDDISVEIVDTIKNNLYREYTGLKSYKSLDILNSDLTEDINGVIDMLKMYNKGDITNRRLTKSIDNGLLSIALENVEKDFKLDKGQQFKHFPDLIVKLFYGNIEVQDDLKRKVVIRKNMFEIGWDGSDVIMCCSYDYIDDMQLIPVNTLNFFKSGMFYVISEVDIEIMLQPIADKIAKEYNIPFEISFRVYKDDVPEDIQIQQSLPVPSNASIVTTSENQLKLTIDIKSFDELKKLFDKEESYKLFVSILQHEFVHFYEEIKNAEKLGLTYFEYADKIEVKKQFAPKKQTYQQSLSNNATGHLLYTIKPYELQANARETYFEILIYLIDDVRKNKIKDKINDIIRNFDDFVVEFLKYMKDDTYHNVLKNLFDIKDEENKSYPMIDPTTKKRSNYWVDGRKTWKKFKGYIIEHFIDVLPKIEQVYDSYKNKFNKGVDVPIMKKEKDEIIGQTVDKTKKIPAKLLNSITLRLLDHMYYSMNSYDNVTEFLEAMNEYYSDTESTEGYIFRENSRYANVGVSLGDYQVIFISDGTRGMFDFDIDKSNKKITINIDDKILVNVYDLTETEFKENYTTRLTKLCKMIAQIE